MANIEFRNSWKLNDERQRVDALAVWEEHKILPVGSKPAKRLAELCSVAYDGDIAIGVATAAISRYEPLRSNIAFARCFVAPGHSMRDALRGLAICQSRRHSPNDVVAVFIGALPLRKPSWQGSRSEARTST